MEVKHLKHKTEMRASSQNSQFPCSSVLHQSGTFNSVILPLVKAPAPWNLVHSFQIQQTPQNPQNCPLQSSGSPPLSLHCLIWSN